MSLSTLRLSPNPRTPHQRVYGRAEQYFDITAPGAHSSGTQFLPSPIADEPTNNWSAEDEAAWDKRLGEGGSKKILTTKKRMDIRWWLQHPTAPLPNGTRQRSATKLISSTKPFSMRFRMARCIARNTMIIDVEKSSPPGTPFAITMLLRFLLPFMRN
jgi:hypothetical protein